MAPSPATPGPSLESAAPGAGRARRDGDGDGIGAHDAGAAGGAPCLDLDGFSGPLDLLLDRARAQRIDLHRIALPDLLDQLAPALRQATSLAERGGWLVMAAWIVLLRSRLLLHEGPAAGPEAPSRADRHARRLRAQLLGLQRVQAVAAWLDRRSQLGRDVFGRGTPGAGPCAGGAGTGGAGTGGAGRVVDVVGFLWATLDLLDGMDAGADAAPASAPPRPALHSVRDACARILQLLRSSPQPQPLARLLPEPTSGEGTAPARAGAPPTPRDALLRRSGWASAFAASLELAKQGQVMLTQDGGFAPILVRAGPEPGTASPRAGRPGRRQAILAPRS